MDEPSYAEKAELLTWLQGVLEGGLLGNGAGAAHHAVHVIDEILEDLHRLEGLDK